MRAALAAAQDAQECHEVPVGAVVVYQNKIVGRGFNQVIARQDPTAHAEVIALREAAQHLANYRLSECDLYVTLEPCTMCSGAIFNARIKNVFYAAKDEKTGVAQSVLNLFDVPQINPHSQIKGGLMAQESIALLQQFFATQRTAA